MIAVVDAGPLYAALDRADRDHERALSALTRPDLRLVVPTLVVTEVCHFAGKYLASGVEAAFLRGLQEWDVQAPLVHDWPRMAELVDQYADFPLGGADASVVALAERLDTDLIVTLDRRHFGAIRPRHCASFRLLPE